jgi:electron transfer flavoprotein beta subunit
MRILACFKVTPDFEMLRESEWVAGAANGMDTRYVRRILNCFDESALEMALRLSEALAGAGEEAGLGAMSVGGASADSFLGTLLALGYERAARVHVDADLDFAPAVTASIVARYAAQVDHSDLLLLGCRSGPGDSGSVPFLVAETLGWPCLTQVVDVAPLPAGRLRVACVVDDGLLRATLRPPCVIAVGNAVVSHLRVPTLTDRLARRDRHADVVAAAQLGVDVAAELRCATSRLAGLETIDRARRGAIIAGGTPREKARLLYDSYLKSMLAEP